MLGQLNPIHKLELCFVSVSIVLYEEGKEPEKIFPCQGMETLKLCGHVDEEGKKGKEN